jgi:hypothetical protein
MTPITIQSAKAKGRRLQQTIRDRLRDYAGRHGLAADDIKSTPMSVSGPDIQFSPAAKRVFNLTIECKNRESLNVTTTFLEHLAAYPDDSMKVLAHSRNNSEPLVTIRFEDFLRLLNRSVETRVAVRQSVRDFNDHIFGPVSEKVA